MTPGHSTVPSVMPQLAVSVLMLRGEVPDLEIFIQNRTLTMDFAAGMVVFPGGRVDEVDRVASRSRPVPPDLLDRQAQCWAETSIGGGAERSCWPRQRCYWPPRCGRWRRRPASCCPSGS